MLRRALHLASILLLSTFVLYGPPVRAATDSPAPTLLDPVKTAHVALLLPTGAEAFVRAAEAVQAGFAEASKKSARPLPARLYPVGDDPQSALSAYRQAVAAGAEFVVGPLTRNAVTALASAGDLISVPTLALNVPDRPGNAAKLYMLSLQVEAEARQVAQLALSEGRRRALSLSDGSPLSRRMRDAFIEEFKRGGGYHIADYAYAADPASLDKLKQVGSAGVVDMVFCAIDAQRFRIARPFLSTVTAYGTSQLHPGVRNPGADMVDVRFVDMPWMVQPDHPAVMVYARSGQRESDDLERLYALGIDAFRLIEDIINGKRDIELDGVTGRLRLGPDRQFRRGLLVTLMDGSRLTVLGESRP